MFVFHWLFFRFSVTFGERMFIEEFVILLGVSTSVGVEFFRFIVL